MQLRSAQRCVVQCGDEGQMQRCQALSLTTGRRWAAFCALMPAPRRRLSALARHLRPRCSCEAELAARASGARVGAIAGGAVQAEEEPMVEMSERDKFMLDLNGFLVVEVSALRQPIVSPH